MLSVEQLGPRTKQVPDHHRVEMIGVSAVLHPPLWDCRNTRCRLSLIATSSSAKTRDTTPERGETYDVQRLGSEAQLIGSSV